MTEEETTEVLTGNVHARIKEREVYTKLRNARIHISNSADSYEGLTNADGEYDFEDIPYGTYTVHVTRPGYEAYTNTLNVNNSSIIIPVFMTPSPVDPNFVELNLGDEYTFNITERLTPQYSLSTQISDWLQTNLSGLRDDQNHLIFGKVNKGFSEESLRTFGKKPVCDVYIDRFSYDSTFTNQRPNEAHTFILYYLKGANTQTYHKACLLHDYIMQELLTNEDWRRLDGKVRDTLIENSEIRIQPLNKKWGVIGAFELTHQLY